MRNLIIQSILTFLAGGWVMLFALTTFAQNNRAQNNEHHIGDYTGQSLTDLESYPGAEKVLYLNITEIMEGETPITLDSQEEMWKAWQTVASAFSMFQLNVTTNPSVYDAAGVQNSGIAKFYNQDGRSNSPINGFGTTASCTIYKTADQGMGLGIVAVRNIGHLMGLLNNDAKQQEDAKWRAVMGTVWGPTEDWGDDVLYQWVKEVEMEMVNELEKLGSYVAFRQDDIPDSVSLKFSDQGDILAENNRGQINTSTDTDIFTFVIGPGGGAIELFIDRTEIVSGSMLDVAAEIRDSNDVVIIGANAPGARFAAFPEITLAPGAYSLVIMGGSEGTPENGFSNYSSLGFYAIEGRISGGVNGDDDDDDTDTEDNSEGDGGIDTDTTGDDDDDNDNNDDNDDDDNNNNDDDDDNNNDNDDNNNNDDDDNNNDDDSAEDTSTDNDGESGNADSDNGIDSDDTGSTKSGCSCSMPGSLDNAKSIFRWLL